MDALTKTLYLDFEAQSKLSLRKVGIYRYARDPSTRITCAGWTLVDHRYPQATDPHRSGAPGAIVMWTRNMEAVGYDLLGLTRWGPDFDAFKSYASMDDVRVVTHNAEVERELLRHKFDVDVPLARISCTAARAARMSLPRSLEGIGAALGLDEQKDMDGHRAMLKLAKPRRPSRENRDEFWNEGTKPEDFLRLYDYCLQDVRTMMAVDLALPELSPEERQVWETTIEMNERGICVDIGSVGKALRIAVERKAELEAEFIELTGVKPGNTGAGGAADALHLPDVQKATIRDQLKVETEPRLRRALEVRQQWAKSSVDKLKAFVHRTNTDCRLRGSLTYSGAERTQRWSGSGVQPQNFPRGLGSRTDEAFLALDGDVLDLAYDDVLKTISGMLKGFFVGPFLIGDYAQIEARALAWFAGQENLLKLFREGGDPYCDLATDIYGRRITKADDKERFMGKQAVLGSGYGVGADTFRALLDVAHDVQISAEMANRAVQTYRRKYPDVVNFWYQMERAAHCAVSTKARRILASKPGLPQVFMGVRDVYERPFLYVELPSGRSLHYAYPEMRRGELVYLGRNAYTHRWGPVSTYGGKLVENIVQAFSRDIMASGLRRLRERDFPLVLTVHDEAASEEPEHQPGRLTKLEEFALVMNQVPEWADGLPLKAECFRAERYRKG